MTEYDYWKIFPRMPKKVTLGDITVRDGFQHLEKFISTRAKIFYAEEMIFAGCKNIEVTNLGNPYLMPQFSDAEQVLAHLRSDRFRERCSALSIRQQVEGSLKRMQTDYIDIYQMHHIDRNTPWEETWQAMETLVQQGKVLYVGSSNFAGWHIAKAQEAAKARHFMGLVSEQSLYNLKDRMVELEVLPACKDYGLGVIPWSPLAGGLLGGVLQKIKEGRRANEDTQKDVKKYYKQLEAWEKFCKQMGEKPADVALAWLLANPVVTAPIIGPRTLEQLTGALRALKIKLSKAEMKKLDEIWPGPGDPRTGAWSLVRGSAFL